ncbi:3'(2'),5'-bisphosphate nucleotidase CysQ [Jannaschia pagri]|uniref:3'(2'),5'-bisphosphate nucleotidase CysQ n=1 Tax=Jannaschia pagri TaxID=2829797 RepID=A0ABQ4NPZ4_9RHOB|nr:MULTISPECIES: 3'(2'),5'-bisphosphate nucleotidase CysQ [unclassified Jannaschia]GIT92680.1 3'(2'),5'-bisphosphate nucleotidase CysQ [Jannaschia sp. AI_61]GIT96460.1 3'(2'),5'-bisphosphate nucleotidase CysQ [Jannaschia sp. AI_62]
MRAADSVSYTDDLSLLTEAARAAGEIARHHFKRDPQVWDKADNQGPVTAADLEIDRMLRQRLGDARPGYGWLSEETPDAPDRLTRERVFVVDPIDGTRAFIKGEDTFSHSLAIVENGRPVAGAVYLPIKDRLYAAALGQGATRDGAPITPSGRTILDGAEVLGTKPNFQDQHWTGGRPPVTQRFVSSLAFRLALAAEGRFDAMITLRNAWEWDIAAGALLVQEAGGLAQTRRGAALRFNNVHPQVDGVVAGTRAVQGALIARLA